MSNVGSLGWGLSIIFSAFLISLLLVSAYIYLAPIMGAMAKPSQRGSHMSATPTGAGIVFLFAITLPLVFFGHIEKFTAFLLSGTLISILGFIDDLRPISLILRLILQFFFLVPMLVFGQSNGLASSILLILVAMLLMNVFNFMDGSDGMAALSGSILLLGWALLGLFYREISVALLSLSFGGSLLGFLVLNWHPAKAFMGDAGSTLIGFAAAAMPFITEDNASQNSDLPAWPLIFFAWIFLFDTVFTRLKRFATNPRFWEPNRDHFYQRLIDSGTAQGSVAFFYGVITLVMTLCALSAILKEGKFYLILGLATVAMPLLLVFAANKKGIDLNI